MPCTTSRVFLSTKTDIKIRKAGKEETICKPGIHKKQQDFLLSCFPDSRFLVSWLPDSLFFSLVNHQLVSVGVTKLRHPANGRLHLFHIERHAAFFELRYCSIDVA